MPLLPCAIVTRPQMQRNFVPLISVCALYTYATRLPR
jgi:hypothetical protein